MTGYTEQEKKGRCCGAAGEDCVRRPLREEGYSTQECLDCHTVILGEAGKRAGSGVNTDDPMAMIPWSQMFRMLFQPHQLTVDHLAVY